VTERRERKKGMRGGGGRGEGIGKREVRERIGNEREEGMRGGGGGEGGGCGERGVRGGLQGGGRNLRAKVAGGGGKG